MSTDKQLAEDIDVVSPLLNSMLCCSAVIPPLRLSKILQAKASNGGQDGIAFDQLRSHSINMISN